MSNYDADKAAKFCEAMACTTDSISKICKRPGMPSKATVFRWKHVMPEFKTMYEEAKLEQIRLQFDECIDIADECEPDKDSIQKAKLQIYARIEVGQRLKPKELGLRTQLTGDGGGAIAHKVVTELSDDELLAIAGCKESDGHPDS